MKIKELKKILNSFSDETEIVLSKDCEGNSFSPLFSASKCLYVASNEFQGKIQSLPDGVTGAEFSNTKAKPALVLFPME